MSSPIWATCVVAVRRKRKKFHWIVQLCLFLLLFLLCTLFRSPLYHNRTFVLIYDFIFAHFPALLRFTIFFFDFPFPLLFFPLHWWGGQQREKSKQKTFHDDETLTDRRNLIISIACFSISLPYIFSLDFFISNFIFHFESISYETTGNSFVKLHFRNWRVSERKKAKNEPKPGRKNEKH